MSEAFVQGQIYSLIKKQFANVEIEVSVLNRCIDIAYFNNEQELVTIEVKLKDWKRAVKQAIDHQLYADKAYICLPKPQGKINQNLIEVLNQKGIGLFWFEAKNDKISYEEYIKPRKNNFCWPVARKKITAMLYA